MWPPPYRADKTDFIRNEDAGAPIYTETGIADLNAAQDHLASSLTGGLYIQADKPTSLSTSEAGLVKAEGGESCSIDVRSEV
jgi:hypothetical protein